MNAITFVSYAVAVVYITVLVYVIFVWNKEDRK
jgi:hypothetical protein